MGIEKGTCGEHGVTHGSDELLGSTPETNVTIF